MTLPHRSRKGCKVWRPQEGERALLVTCSAHACSGPPEVVEAGASLGRLQGVLERISPQSVFFVTFVIAPVLSALAFLTAHGVVEFG